LAEANGSDESRRAPLEPWIPWSCHEVWGEKLVQPNHLENDRRRQKIYILEKLYKRVLGLQFNNITLIYLIY